MSVEFRPLGAQTICALEPHAVNPADTSWSEFNYYLMYSNIRTYVYAFFIYDGKSCLDSYIASLYALRIVCFVVMVTMLIINI